MKTLNRYTIMMVKDSEVTYDFDPDITGPDAVYRVLDAIGLKDRAEEEFWMLCLNTKNKITGVHQVSVGNLNSSIVHPREVFKRAMLNNAASIIVAHNHPSGDPAPSQNDIDVTKRLADAGKLMGITLMDHIITGDSNLSMKEKMLI